VAGIVADDEQDADGRPVQDREGRLRPPGGAGHRGQGQEPGGGGRQQRRQAPPPGPPPLFVLDAAPHGGGRRPRGPRVMTHSSLFLAWAAVRGPVTPAGPGGAPFAWDVRRMELDAPATLRATADYTTPPGGGKRRGRNRDVKEKGGPRSWTWPYSGRR